jgi:hypothetical protein
MDFRVENFISPRNLQILSRTGLHKTAGALNGIDEMTIKHAVAIIGTKARQKRAEAQTIQAGIEAYAALRGEKTAGPGNMSLLQHGLKGIPAALLGGGIGYAMAPNDPEEEKRKMQQGALMGLIGGTLHSVHKGM